ncbi:MAG: antibiotic biosynthesis monooxygenase [Acidimicrobiaceae bacterium]|nr:antibiotic biosynthesis monooxygenase [Acidimicrobiaceae bacterium]
MTVVTIFRSRLREGVDDAYVEVATHMSRLVRDMDGFLSEKFYLSPDGERVTIVRFRDADSQRKWAEHPEHRVAQQRGRDEFYLWYDITVADESYARTFSAQR